MTIPLDPAAAAMRQAMRHYQLCYLLRGILTVVAGGLALVYSGAPAAAGDPVGYVLDGTQHVVYRAGAPSHIFHSHIHELWWAAADGWHHNDLTNATGAPVPQYPKYSDDPRGYVLDDTQHVVYRAWDGHIHELWWAADGWHYNDLTNATGAPAAQRLTEPAGYVLDDTQHVVYRGSDKHIHELWWAAADGWHHNDLTNATGAPAAEEIASPAGYVLDDTQHVVYRGRDNEHIHELWWSAADGWHHNDLTNATGAPVADWFADPAGYVLDDTQHVVYRGSDRHIHELWRAADGWHHNDLTNAAGAPVARVFGDPAGYVLDDTQHVVYRGSDMHIHELWWAAADGWHHNDLTNATGAPVALEGLGFGDPAGYVLDDTQHVVYRGSDIHIHELWWAAADGWHHNDLTNAAGAPDANY